jgi:hypothetical protein
MSFQDTEGSNMTPEELEKLLTKFEDFQRQKTFHDSDIHTEYLRAFDYYTANHPIQDVGRYMFPNFVAGYLMAKLDADKKDKKGKETQDEKSY